jgi:Ca-activated chloride channel family protein
VKLRYKLPSGETSRLFSHAVTDRGAGARRSHDFYFSAAVAGFGMLLRDSKWKGNATVDGMLELARGSLGADRDGYRRDFVALVERYRRIARHEPVGPEDGEVADR